MAGAGARRCPSGFAKAPEPPPLAEAAGISRWGRGQTYPEGENCDPPVYLELRGPGPGAGNGGRWVPPSASSGSWPAQPVPAGATQFRAPCNLWAAAMGSASRVEPPGLQPTSQVPDNFPTSPLTFWSADHRQDWGSLGDQNMSDTCSLDLPEWAAFPWRG